MSGLYQSEQLPFPSLIETNSQYQPQHQVQDIAETGSRISHEASWLDNDIDNLTELNFGTSSSVRTAAGAGATQPMSSYSTEHVKHRRTRSGCYTCRSRRVKCDEARPTCERCRKGSRDCVYPEPRSSTRNVAGAKSTGHQTISNTIDESPSSDEADEPEGNLVDSAKGARTVGKTTKHLSGARKHARSKAATANRKSSNRTQKKGVTSLEQIDLAKKDKTLLVTDGLDIPGVNLSPDTTLPPQSLSVSHLPEDYQYYLEYHCRKITYHHYFFRHNADHFVQRILVEHALLYEPLLCALVGFAAFQSTLEKPDGKIQHFLKYYDRSVSLLRQSLARGQMHTDATMMTILQLAAIEEYLGDWGNLFGHQKAAYSMLSEIYSAESIMETEVRRKMLSWYARFDLFAGLMSGYETVLGREWFLANEQYYLRQTEQYPENTDCRIELAIASHRLMAMDMALLFAKLPRGDINVQDFSTENELLASRIASWKKGLDPLLADTRFLVTSIKGVPLQDFENIASPYKPGTLYSGPLWSLNFLLLDGTALTLMRKYQTSLILQQPAPPDLRSLASDMCRIFEAIELWPGSYPGSLVAAQATLGIATLFLPKDEKHTMWCRQKLAAIESRGYTYPPTFRAKMAELWGLPEILHWWLPNDEGYPAIIRSIRSFIEDRTLKSSEQAKTEDVRNMKAILSKLSLDESTKDDLENNNN